MPKQTIPITPKDNEFLKASYELFWQLIAVAFYIPIELFISGERLKYIQAERFIKKTLKCQNKHPNK